MLKASEISPETLTLYARSIRARAEANREVLEARRLRAWQVAHQAATLLKTRFGAQRVVLFGSLARGPGRFYALSDIDLAVFGLDDRRYFHALDELLQVNPEFEVDLVAFESARPELRAAILQEGFEL